MARAMAQYLIMPRIIEIKFFIGADTAEYKTQERAMFDDPYDIK